VRSTKKGTGHLSTTYCDEGANHLRLSGGGGRRQHISMRSIRRLEERFEASTVEQIRALQLRLERLQITFSASRYFGAETIRCLEAGLILAALQVSTSMLELLVRETVIDRRMGRVATSPRTDLDALECSLMREAEEDRSLSFVGMVRELEQHQALNADEADRLRSTYRDIRIQLHHAIIGRFVRQRGPTELHDFREKTGLAKTQRTSRRSLKLKESPTLRR